MFVGHANHAGKGRLNALETSLAVVIAEKLASYVATQMGKGKSQRGNVCSSELICCKDTHMFWTRQLATLSAKVQTYEEVIRKMSTRFGVSDEQLLSNAMTSVCYHVPIDL